MFKYLPLSEPYLDKSEIKSVSNVIKNNWVSTAGKEINTFEKLISRYTKSKHSVACINGTSALHIALKIAGVKKNDEVIIPTLTFIAPVYAIKYIGASPVFMDVDIYHNLDIAKTIDYIKNNTEFKNGYSYNKNTKKRISAIVIVHVWGNAVNIYSLISICKNTNIKIVEDASESLGTWYKKGKNKFHTGTLGFIGCLSFNGNKIITTGGGGMILTNNAKHAKKAEYLINQAKDDSVFFKHDNIGYNYRLTNLQAALGIPQIKKIKKILNKKKIINNLYKKELLNLSKVKIYKNPKYSLNNNWINIVEFKGRVNIKKIIDHFEKNKIQVRPIWKLNHTQKQFKKCETYKIENAKKIIKNSLCLPSSYNLNKKDILRIVKCFKDII